MKLSFNIKLLVLIILFQLLGFNVIHAQESDSFILSGIVTSNKQEKLTGVNVYIKGTTNGTVTNENGYYSLQIPEGYDTIVFSFIGYQTHSQALTQSQRLTTLNITLKSIEAMLQEISITSQRKFFGNMDYGRDIPTVKSEEIEKLNSTNASDILHARLAGVWATKTSGAPGDQQKIRIRGQASFFSSAEPLYVIDGVPVPIVNLASLGIGDLNMHDIESVTVLKDASSTALYGYQGSNGVVLIDTKQRSDNKLNFSYKTGLQRFSNYYDLMNTQDFLNSLNLAHDNLKLPYSQFYPVYSDNLNDNNRQDEIFKTGLIQEFQLSSGGRFGDISYYLSGNYNDQKGILEGSEQKKYTFSSRIGTTVKNKLALTASYRWNYQENINNQNEYLGNPLLFIGLSTPSCSESIPDSLLYNSVTGLLNSRTLTSYELLNKLITPETIIEDNNHTYNYFTNAVSLVGKYQLNRNWKIDIMESIMLRHSTFTNNGNFYRTINSRSAFIKSVDIKSKENISLFNHQVGITYSKEFNMHQFEVLFAQRSYLDNLWWEVDSLGSNIPEHYYLRNSMAGHGKKGSVVRNINSYIGHIGYNYKNKYFLSGIANLSQLKEGLSVNYFTLFPSISASWDIAKESFITHLNWLNEFSIYSNYGISGNYPLNGLSNNLVRNPSADYVVYNSVQPDSITDYNPDYKVIKQLANHFLKHEDNKELDIGLKLSALDRRLRITTTKFSKRIGNQIILRDIPYYYGGGKMYLNLGDIAVKGYEIALETTPIENKIISWNIAANLISSKQHIAKIADDQNMMFYSDDMLFPSFNIKEGEALGDIYGYKYLGKWTEADEQNRNINYVKLYDLKFANSDTLSRKLDENDKMVIGNSIPDFNWNFMSSFRYKNLTLDISVYSSIGVQKFNETRAATYITGVNRELTSFYKDSLSATSIRKFYESSYFVEDASFIRLKTVSLTYLAQKKFIGANYSVMLSAENLLTLTNYHGFDPEATIFTDNNFSDNAVDRGAYPNPRSIYLTVSLKF